MPSHLESFVAIEEKGTAFEREVDYHILCVDGNRNFGASRYILNPDEPGTSLMIYPAEVEIYLEMLTWIRDHAARAQESL